MIQNKYVSYLFLKKTKARLFVLLFSLYIFSTFFLGFVFLTLLSCGIFFSCSVVIAVAQNLFEFDF